MSDLIHAFLTTIGLAAFGAGVGWALGEVAYAWRRRRRRLALSAIAVDVPEHTRCADCQISLSATGGLEYADSVDLQMINGHVTVVMVEVTVCPDCYMGSVAA